MAGAALIITILVATLAWTTYALRGQVDEFLTSLPQLTAKVRQSIVGTTSDKPGAFARVQAAAAIESAASGRARPHRPRVGRSRCAAGEAGRGRCARCDASWIFAERDTGRRGVRGAGTGRPLRRAVPASDRQLLPAQDDPTRPPEDESARITIQALDEVHLQIQRYLIVQVATSALVGVVTGIVFIIGLHNAAIWGVVAGFANLVPYIGSVATSGFAAVADLVQFGIVGVAFGLASARSGFISSSATWSRRG